MKTRETFSEEILISDLQNKDTQQKAFKVLLDTYHEPLYWFIRKKVIQHEWADDVLQNTFIRAFKHIEKLDSNSNLKNWLYRIAYNEAMRLLKKESRYYHQMEGEDWIEMLQESPYIDMTNLTTEFYNSLKSLTKKQREVFQLKYFDELTFKEISALINTNENTLKSNYYAAEKHIKSKLKQLIHI